MKKVAALLAFGFALVTTLTSHADIIQFSATGSGFESSGTLTISPDSTQTGTFDVTDISGEVNGVSITGLIPGSYNVNAPTTNTNGVFIFDNLVYSTPLILDINGLGVNIGTAGEQGNFFYQSGAYYFLDSSNALTTLDNFNANVTPEPSTLMLFGTGAIGLAGTLRKRLMA